MAIILEKNNASIIRFHWLNDLFVVPAVLSSFGHGTLSVRLALTGGQKRGHKGGHLVPGSASKKKCSRKWTSYPQIVRHKTLKNDNNQLFFIRVEIQNQ